VRRGVGASARADRAAHEPSQSTLHPLRGLDSKIEQSLEIIDAAIREHGNCTHLFGLFSGGHDSVCSTHVAAQHPAFTRAATINTTIGIEETRQYARNVSQIYGWGLLEYLPPVSYRDIVLKHGFPGPGGHAVTYARLKERCIRQLVRDHKAKRFDRIGLITGVRLSESVRRMGHVEAIQREGAQLWIAPILHWSDDDKLEYMARHNIPRNPVVDTICMSGECLCGAFAKKEELFDLEQHYPAVAAVIHELQREAEAAGVHAKWGTRPPGGKLRPTMGGKLCRSCNLRNLEFDFLAEAA
jgi:3'-phosphoadenosine 5'-phosphosulfate sulfotransferase (PAPS reductase)/FAD synthetase